MARGEQSDNKPTKHGRRPDQRSDGSSCSPAPVGIQGQTAGEIAIRSLLAHGTLQIIKAIKKEQVARAKRHLPFSYGLAVRSAENACEPHLRCKTPNPRGGAKEELARPCRLGPDGVVRRHRGPVGTKPTCKCIIPHEAYLQCNAMS